MIDSAVLRFPDQETQINDLSAGIFNSILGLGQISGPIYGSLVTSYIGFRLCSESVAFVCLVFAFVYFTFGKGLDAFSKKRVTYDIEEDSSFEKSFLVTDTFNGSTYIPSENATYRSLTTGANTPV